MTSYQSFPIQDLPHAVGEDRPGGIRVLNGEPGVGSHGPYTTLNPGRYFGGFYVRALEGAGTDTAMSIDVCCDLGRQILAQKSFPVSDFNSDVASLHGVHFTISREESHVEVRLDYAGVGTFEVTELVVFRTDLR